VTVIGDPSLHRESLFRFFMRRLRDPWVSDDLVQETFTRLLTYQQTRKVGDAGALCHHIARNVVRDHFRANRDDKSEELGEELVCTQPIAEEVVMHRERVAAFEEALGRMPPLRREVFVRRRLKGESLSDIAKILGISEAAAEKHMARALKWLHGEMSRRDRARPAAPILSRGERR
jgi:RNA polymerase sigma-70 factor (ECF subfamily)